MTKKRDWDELERQLLSGQRLLRPVFDAETMTALRMRKSRLLQPTFNECHIERMDASEAYMPEAKFTNCIIANSLFCNTYLRKATFVRCVFEATDFTGCLLAEVRFSECTIVNCRFDQGEFPDAVFENTRIQTSTFFLSDLTRTPWESVKHIRASLRGALLPIEEKPQHGTPSQNSRP